MRNGIDFSKFTCRGYRMEKSALIQVIKPSLEKANKETLIEMIIDYDLLHMSLYQTKEEVVSIICDEIIGMCTDSFEAIDILNEYGISLDL